MARVSSINKHVTQKRKADSSESEDDYIFPKDVNNATGIDLPDNNAATEESKEEEHDAAENIVQCPNKKPAPDGNDGSISSSVSGGDGEGVGGSAGAWGRRLHTPEQGLLHSSDNSILRLLTR